MTRDADGSAPMRGSGANRQAKLDGWIPVTERLPDDGVVVLAWQGKRVVFGYARDGDWIDTLYGWVIPNGPSHWMPLPQPPCEMDH